MIDHDLATIILIIVIPLDIFLIYKHLKWTPLTKRNVLIILISGLLIYFTIGTGIWGLPAGTQSVGSDPWGDNSAIQLPAIAISVFPGLLITWILEWLKIRKL